MQKVYSLPFLSLKINSEKKSFLQVIELKTGILQTIVFEGQRHAKKAFFHVKFQWFQGGDIGETPLHIAARIEEARGEKCTKMLLKSGADSNLAMKDGRTPLHIAAECGSLAVLKLLLAHDADPLQNDGVS